MTEQSRIANAMPRGSDNYLHICPKCGLDWTSKRDSGVACHICGTPKEWRSFSNMSSMTFVCPNEASHTTHGASVLPVRNLFQEAWQELRRTSPPKVRDRMAEIWEQLTADKVAGS